MNPPRLPASADQQTLVASISGARWWGWPLAGLIYLSFVFLPLAFQPRVVAHAWTLSVLACLLFLLAYRGQFRQPTARWPMFASAVLGFALIPFNPGGNTFIIYAMSFAASRLGARATLLFSAILLLLMAGELYWMLQRLNEALAFTGVVAIIGGMVVAGTLTGRIEQRRHADLLMSQDEVRRLARLAERERIARDLHDLLGHTLSVIVLKSELAGKLLARDGQAAAQQIGEVEQVARQALRDMRDAVSRIRGGSLAAELAAAQLSLRSAGLQLHADLPAHALPEHADAELALCLREAITNVLRHARAQHVQVSLQVDEQGVRLAIADDGRGGPLRAGNGLRGMAERLQGLGGELRLAPAEGNGTQLECRLPASVLSEPDPAAATGDGGELQARPT